MLSISNKILVKELCKNGHRICEISKKLNINYDELATYICGNKIQHKSPSTSLNLSNQKLGRLLVVNKINQKKNGTFLWECKCDCGKTINCRSSDLRSGKIKSCGCLASEVARNRCKTTGKHHIAWKGYGEMSGCYIQRSKKRAKQKNREFNITSEYIWKKFIEQNQRCAISGVELKFNFNGNSSDGNASLDRIDSSKGYIEGNVQWVHKDVNKMKMDSKQADFLNWISIIYKNQCYINENQCNYYI